MAGRSAQIICGSGSYWVTPKVFWQWVKEGRVKLKGEYPLRGNYQGESADSLVSVNHVILDSACPEHLNEVTRAQRRRRACA